MEALVPVADVGLTTDFDVSKHSWPIEEQLEVQYS